MNEDFKLPQNVRDRVYYEALQRHSSDEDIIFQLSVFQRRMYFTRTIVHYEIFKMIQDIPGSIADCGVYKGESLFNWARFLEMYCPGDRTRIVYGFDDFKGLRDFSKDKDIEGGHPGAFVGGYAAENFKSTLLSLVDCFNEDSFVPQKPRIKLVDGDVNLSIENFVKEYAGEMFSLIHIDIDLYQPTLSILEHLYPKLVPGGVVLLDEYAHPLFPGETNAVNDFFNGRPPRIQKLPLVGQPGGYFIKPYLE